MGSPLTFRHPDMEKVVAFLLLTHFGLRPLLLPSFFSLELSLQYLCHYFTSHPFPSFMETDIMDGPFVYLSYTQRLHIYRLLSRIQNPSLEFLSSLPYLKGYSHILLALIFFLLSQDNPIALLAQPPLNLPYISIWLLFLFCWSSLPEYLESSCSTCVKLNTLSTDVLCPSLLLS